MSQTYLPRQAAPVERTLTGTATTDTAGLEQSFRGRTTNPFADEGDE
ncbi:hypothetical protein GCM10022419_130770 [Nonomuraea rosea]|uniref:Lasso RiPP family leader peptide-containing protein n=1 Tax=Nonomuraea rosea TaxID=638574 RepID=A0ABP7A021_9ACTN